MIILPNIGMMAKKIPILIFLFIYFLSVYPVLAQDNSSISGSNNSTKAEEPLPAGFMDITLGMEINDVKEKLKENSYFNYRGDPDVSMLMTRSQQLIECSGFSFIEKGYFQFYEGKLFIITLVLNTERIDFYTMHTNFEEKYSKPTRVDPKGVYWENSEVNLYLEKPLSVKYMDRKVLDKLASERKEVEDRSGKIKEDFLNLF
ncbi:MAG: hypothetical protein FWE72_07895 [Spirochaetaceae bacterium]|nr:hypothetical protein [Spirochaetaceae bacterium]